MSQSIQTADLDWQCVEGIDVPVSKQFGDVYFSKDNGLLESRHVFLGGNDLSQRLSQLEDYAYFSVAETGFGTGLNILALWQLWQQQRPDNHSHLHAISVEKFPLSRRDLIRALAAWPELSHLAEQLIAVYPLALAGCHRLNFPNERFSIDLWLGDAQDIFPEMIKTHAIDAWFLDGFAPSCNPDLWEAHVLDHIVRLSDVGTSFASFSVAGVLKRGLKKHGIQISRPRGFGHKREMLKAIWTHSPCADTQPELPAELESTMRDQTICPPSQAPQSIATSDSIATSQSLAASQSIAAPQALATSASNTASHLQTKPQQTKPRQRRIAVIGAGIAGLSSAYALAKRGHLIDLYDQSGVIAGASGNPVALINPMLNPASQSATHLMTLAWPYALQHYARFNAFDTVQVNQLILKEPEQAQQLLADFPEQQLSFMPAAASDLKTKFDSVRLNRAATIRPQQLADEILALPNIQFQQATLLSVDTQDTAKGKQYQLHFQEASTKALPNNLYDHVVICCGCATQHLIEGLPPLKPNRGQVSWLNNAHAALSPQQAYSYGGYCVQMDPSQLLLGASFYPHRDDDAVLHQDHVHNFELIHNAFPDYAAQLPDISSWQGRASIRSQSADYFPFLGRMDLAEEIYSFTALGSKGFLFAPLLSEVLAAQILGENCPMSASVYHMVNPRRFIKKQRVRKPYYQGPYAKK